MLDIIGIVVVIAMYFIIFHDSYEKELSAKGNEKKKTFIVGKPQGVHSHHFNYTKVHVSVHVALCLSPSRSNCLSLILYPVLILSSFL